MVSKSAQWYRNSQWYRHPRLAFSSFFLSLLPRFHLPNFLPKSPSNVYKARPAIFILNHYITLTHIKLYFTTLHSI